MNRLIKIFCLCVIFGSFFSGSASAQRKKDNNVVPADSVSLYIADRLTMIESHQQYSTYHSAGRYRLYPTENTYNFLQLNTQTGEVYQIQWSSEKEEEFTVAVNSKKLVDMTMPIGTFEMYPTENMYQFLLLNTISGEVYHLQWGMNKKERWIRKI